MRNIVSVIVLYYYTFRYYALIKRKITNSTSKLQTDALEHTMIALLSQQPNVTFLYKAAWSNSIK